MRRQILVVLAAAFLVVAGVPAAGTPSEPAAVRLPAVDAGEITTSYDDLVQHFYKRLPPQTIVDGARDGLLRALARAGIRDAHLPPLRAGETDQQTAAVLEAAVRDALVQAHGRLSPRSLSYAAIGGMMASARDRWTVFLTPKEYAALNKGLDGGHFGGIGVVIQIDDATKYIAISNVIPNGPADKAGLQQNDLITAIDGVSTRGMSLPQASAKLRGKAGTVVHLTIERDGRLLASPVSIVRAEIPELSVFEKMLPGDIGYVEITVFGRDTGDELRTDLQRLRRDGMKALVLDLRDNGGGYLQAAISVCSAFIAEGPIVSVLSRGSNLTTIEADDTAFPPVPLVVLVDKNTASASEITTGALQDDGVATVIGTRTFGKGVVQTIYQLPDGAAVKITTARYYTPLNHDIDHLGIQPDIVVPENAHPRYGDLAHDAQLRRAVQFLQDRLAHANPTDYGV